jgi:hypothetical protein
MALMTEERLRQLAKQPGAPRYDRKAIRKRLREKYAEDLAYERAGQHRVPKFDRVRCGARTRQGAACKRLPVPGSERCKNHGGLSSGPRTEAGKQRIAAAQRRRWAAWRAQRTARTLALP